MRNKMEYWYSTLTTFVIFGVIVFIWLAIVRRTKLMENQVIAQRLALHNVTTELDTLKMEVRHTRALASSSQRQVAVDPEPNGHCGRGRGRSRGRDPSRDEVLHLEPDVDASAALDSAGSGMPALTYVYQPEDDTDA
jgi:hypothetical protein